MKTMESRMVVRYGIILMLAVFLVGGCASVGTLHTTTPMMIKLAQYKTILVRVWSQVPESTQEVIELETMVIAKLRERNLFEKVVSDLTSPDAADLRLNLRIVHLKKVSPGARVMLGALAGQAVIVVDAELVDQGTGKSIGNFLAEGKSSGGTVFAGTTTQAIERVVEQIVEFLVKNI